MMARPALPVFAIIVPILRKWPAMCLRGEGPLRLRVPSRANRRVGRGRLSALPPDCDDGGHDRWSDKQSDQAKRLQAAKDAEENPQERQASRCADQRRADEMIGNEDHD